MAERNHNHSSRFKQIGTDSLPDYKPVSLETQIQKLREYITRTEKQLTEYREVLKGLEEKLKQESSS